MEIIIQQTDETTQHTKFHSHHKNQHIFYFLIIKMYGKKSLLNILQMQTLTIFVC